jgi:hypothetical protein
VFGQNAYLLSVFDDRDATALAVVEFLSMIQPLPAPNGIYDSGVAIQLNGDLFSSHGL